jgi:hypothetical protein
MQGYNDMREKNTRRATTTPSNNSPQQVEGPDEPPSPITSPPASPAASPKCKSSRKPQQEENDWDFD